MRIIENRYGDKQQEYEITCPHCKSKLSYTFDDIVSDRFEGEYLYCGACGKEIYLDDGIPTADTIQYPKDFFSYANGVPIKDDEINKWVKECVNDLND
jgi:DNA-directed RNA polymerase subunit RPC12/RpoP